MLTTQLKKIALIISVTSIAVVGVVATNSAQASAPMAKISTPGFYRMMLGNFEVTAINDGTVDLPVEKLLKQPTEKTVNELGKAFLKTPTETSVNTFLINTGTKLVLVDTGAGNFFGPTLGKLIANIKASGYEPEQIDDVFITHMHSDHIGGSSANGATVFPNAIVHADQHDADYWLSQANLDKAPEDQKSGFQNAMTSFNPYITAKRFVPFNGAAELVPGIKSYPAYGHTVGHTVYVVENSGQKLFLIGDLIHVGAVQFEHPEVTITFDSDEKEARAERNKIFSEAAKEGAIIGAAHLQFPALGHVVKKGKSYEWLPVNFTQFH